MARKTRTSDGYAFECSTRDTLRNEGFTIVRAAASQGKLDLVGIRPNELLFIQCKWTSNLPVTSLSVCPPQERAEVMRLARMVNAVPLLAYPHKEGNRAERVRFWKIIGPKPYDFQRWSPSRVSA